MKGGVFLEIIDFISYYNRLKNGDQYAAVELMRLKPQIDDIAVTSLADYYSALESKRAGDVITVVVRRNRKNVTLKIKLVES